MKDFTFSVPQNIVVGKGSMAKLPEIVRKRKCSHVFIISDPHLEKLGIVERCVKDFRDHGIAADVYAKTEGNPSVETTDRATECFVQSGADCIVALGGGSPMDVAKAVGILARYGGKITDYEGADRVPGDIVPLIAVPTTAGTGSETTAFSVITDHSRDYKLTVFSYKLIPAYAVLDADLIITVPQSVAAACGMDALIHGVEAYLSKAASPFSDAMAEKAMELIGGNLRRYVAGRDDTEAAEAMLVGSLFAGIAFSWARLGNVHAMSHPVSACFNVPHGMANAILLPVVMEYNAAADRGRYKKIYGYVTGKVPGEEFCPQMLTEEIRRLNASLGIPSSLSAVGVTEDKIAFMAADAMKSGNIAVNPRSTTKQDIEELYRKAMG